MIKIMFLSFACMFSLLTPMLLLTNTAEAHLGRTKRNGCHVCRTNCPYWGYAHGSTHCH